MSPGSFAALVALFFGVASAQAQNGYTTPADANGNSIYDFQEATTLAITCPANVTATNALNTCGAAVVVPAPSASGYCGSYTLTNSFNGTANASGTYPVGVTTVTWTATDPRGQTASCSMTVTVTDTQLPAITCPANITVGNDAGVCGAVASYVAPVGSDNCPGATTARIAGPASGSLFPNGTTTVTHRVTDAAGNTAQCSFTVTVNDTQLPVITCPGNIVVSNDPGVCGATVSYAPPVGTDNCPGPVTVRTAGLAPGSLFPLGTTTITYRVTDAAGNIAQCSFTVTVNDTQVPTITCPANVAATTNTGCTATGVALGTPTTADNCGVATVTNNAPAAFPLGITTVTWTVTDNSGNTATCAQTVTVTDNVNPTITCPANVSATTNTGCTATGVALGTPVTNDNCGVASVTNNAPAAFPLGVTTVTWTVTDNSGRTATCTQTVTVTDNVNPTITCPANVSATTNTGCIATGVALGTPVTNDNCGVASLTNNAPAAFPLGATTVTWTVTDNSGRTATCAQTVTVTDNVNPTITCPANVAATTNTGCTATGVALGTPVTNDNCGVASVTNNAPAAFPLGVTTVTWTVTDNSGRTATCAQTVTVTDNVNPTITCPANVTATTNTGCTATGVALGTPVTNDNCGVASVTNNAPVAFALGVTTVTWTVTDNSGRTATCAQTVTVTDNVNPTITCPANVAATTNTGCTATGVALGTPVTNDNCGVASVTNNAPAAFPLGVTTVTWTVTDNSGRTATCAQTVTVTDNDAPIAVCQPATIGLDGSGIATLTAADVNGGSTDNCSIASISVVPNTFNAVGTYTATLTVTDAAGNSSTCTATVTVTDSQPPVAICQNITINLNAGGTVTITAAQIDGGSTDNGTITSLVASQTNFDCTDLGPNNVTLTVTDDGGNTTQCTAVVTVQDIIAPAAICQNATIYLDGAGNASIAAADLNNGSTDNCSIATIIASKNDFTCADLGANVVTVTVTDQSGNGTNCNATVTVVDDIDPTITCPATVNATTNSGCTATGVNLGVPVTADNCSVASVSHNAPVAFPIGSTTVTWTVTDGSGNTATCTQTVIVTDNVPPTITCPVNVSANTNSGCTATGVNLGTPVTNDNCGVATVSNNAPAAFPLGNTAVTWTVVDNSGNTSTCVQTVTVVDNGSPSISCPPHVNTTTNSGCTATGVNLGVPITSDNCSVLSVTNNAPVAFPLGTTTVMWIVMDNSSNGATCMQSVTVTDNVPPTITCPAAVNVNTNSGCTATGVALGTPTTADNCGVASVTNNAPAVFPIGSTTVTWTVTDNSGNSSNCAQTVNVTDITLPTITCPANVSVGTNSGCTATGVALGTPVTNDNCGVASVTNNAPAAFPLGATIVTWTVTDNSGNLATCTQTVTVTDNVAPTIACPPTVNATTNSGCTATGVNLGIPVTNDNCGVSNVVNDAPAAFPLGSTTVTWTVTDNAGNTTSCTQTVNVLDDVPPVAVCQAVTLFLDGTGSVGLAASAVDNGSSDNCGIASLNVSPNSFNAVGTYTATLTVVDNSGNSSTCTALITVNDLVPPVAVCQPVTIYLDGSGNATIVAGDIDGGSTDNDAIASLVASQTNFDCSNTGDNNVTLTVTDDGGNTASCVAVVTVLDTIRPSVVCNGVTVSLNNFGSVTIDPADVAMATTDNCGSGPLTFSTSDSTFIAVGSYTVWVYVIDEAGNIDSCQAVVTVNDLNPPVAICQPATIYLDGSGNASITPADIDGGSTDNGTIVSITASQTNFDCTNTGANTVTLSVTDDGGNTSTCDAVVTVLDTIAPVAVCQNITVALDGSGNASIVASDIDGGSSDNCAGFTLSVSQAIFDCSMTGANTVTLTVTDASGNVSTCDATVTIEDNTIPTVVCNDVTINMDTNGWAVINASAMATATTDNCGGGTLEYTTSVDSINVVGTQTVWVYVQDASGNIDSCSATVTVTDLNPPTAICQAATIYLDGSGGASIVAADINGGSTDNGTIVSITASQTNFDCTNTGANGVWLYVTDDGGNIDSCQATVTVLDTIAPVAVCQNITVALDGSGNANITANDIDGGSGDNCAGFTLSASQTNFDCSMTGANTVTLTVTDASGNVSTCDATVTIEDNTIPTVVCNSATINIGLNGWAVINADALATASSDNCGNAALDIFTVVDSINVVGDSTIWVYVQDAAGNIDSCQATVTITDLNPPTAICQPVTIHLDGSGNASITPADIDGGSTDNGTIVSITASQTAFDCTNTGANGVWLYVTDDGGNIDSCQATVTVLDTIAPNVSCQDFTVYLDASGVAQVQDSDIIVGTADNCSPLVSTVSASQFTNIGTYPVTVTITDPSGNSSSCSSIITVLDTIVPQVNCLAFTGVVLHLDSNGQAVLDPAQLDGGSSDNDTIVALTASQVQFDCGDIGNNSVTLYATDAAGNVDSCFAVVTVLDTIAPSVICQNITIALDGSGNATISSAQLDNGSSDNCTLASTSASQTTFDCSAVGVNVVTLTAIDASGNTSSCNALVTVIDTIMPVAVCNNITIYLDGSGVATITGQDIDGGSTDNCGTLTYTASQTSFDSVGVYTVILTVTDGSGNSSSCTATVTVNDIVAPEANCQAATIYLDGNGNASITPADIDGGSTDNGTIVGITASQTAFTCNDLGINDVILTVTDDGGNNDSCIAVVTVLDTIAPVAVCNNITIYLDGSGVAIITGQDIDGGSTDNCGMLTYSVSDTSFDNVGTYTVTLTVTDGSGNSSTCTATVTVNDVSLPTANCQPATIYLDASGNASITAADIDGGSTDNSVIVALVASQTAFDCGDLGANDVILTVTDDSGNSDSCIAVVTVLDTIAPNVVCNNITIYLDGNGNVEIIGEDIDGGSTDNCGTLSYSASTTIFTAPGTYQVTLIVTDASGNSSSCTATVEVLVVNLPPVAVDDSISTSEGEAVVIGNEANDSDPNNDPFSTTDASAGVGSVEINGDGTLTYTPATGWCGTDTVTYTICDSLGLCDAAIILVTVVCDNDLVIPHGFSPNGDGISDTWVIQGLENYPDNSVKLFNRWGAEIYDAAPYGNDWDGRSTAPMTINGQLPAGTYFFILDLGNGTVETGDLYLSN